MFSADSVAYGQGMKLTASVWESERSVSPWSPEDLLFGRGCVCVKSSRYKYMLSRK